MRRPSLHPSLNELLHYADGELSLRAQAKTRSHLAKCPECERRLRQLREASADFIEEQETAPLPVADISGPRALLKARMAEVARISHGRERGRLRVAMNLAYACALALLVAVGVMALKQSHRHEAAYARLRPDPTFTPGLTREASLAALCSVDHDDVVRAVPAALQQRVFSEYGISGRPASEYEVDYLITPGLGGAEDVRNLWPQPHAHTIWNSYAKDQLEDHLHGMVCSGQLSLQVAQNEISHDWIAAYKKYFHTEQPVIGALPAAVAEESSLSYQLAAEAPF